MISDTLFEAVREIKEYLDDGWYQGDRRKRIEALVAQMVEVGFELDSSPSIEDVPPLPCKDCGVNTLEINEFYMVLPAIWERVGDGDGYLCIGCLEKRLGRELCGHDFTDAPCNVSMRVDRHCVSDRLYDRLTRREEKSA